MSQPQPIGGTPKYHWWYDSKAAGVRNAPPEMKGMSGTPPSSPPAMGIGDAPRRFSLTSGFTNASPPTDIAARPRRDSLKNIYHLSDFGTPGT
jgi:hypothetical protein